MSLTVGAHRHSGQDLDGDGWYDMPSYERFRARPRFQWDDEDGSSPYLTLGAMTEERVGGNLPANMVPDGTSFVQTQDTERYDAGLVAEMLINGIGSLYLCASANRQDHLHRYGRLVENDHHTNLFAEASFSGSSGGTCWVGGVTFQSDRFRSETFPVFDCIYDAPAAFAQVEQQATMDLTQAASARIDLQNEFGTQFSPRLSALYRPGNLTIRGLLGSGFFFTHAICRRDRSSRSIASGTPMAILRPKPHVILHSTWVMPMDHGKQMSHYSPRISKM